jgi:hypothetical protein
MSVAFTVAVKDPNHAADSLDGTLAEDFSVAAGDWLQHLTGLGSIDFEIDIGPTPAGRAESAPAVVLPAGTAADGTPVYEPGTLYELRTGIDPNGAAPDAVISIDPNYLRQAVWADPTPADTTDAVPGDRVDLVSVLRHETGHTLGIISATPGGGGSVPWETTFDQQTVARSDGAFFVGEHARAAYGGDVPLTTLPGGEAYSHLGNSLAEPAGTDLMNGVAFYLGTRYEVSPLDLAILEDIGAPVVPSTIPEDLVASSWNGHYHLAQYSQRSYSGQTSAPGHDAHHDTHHDPHHDPHLWGGHEHLAFHHNDWA